MESLLRQKFGITEPNCWQNLQELTVCEKLIQVTMSEENNPNNLGKKTRKIQNKSPKDQTYLGKAQNIPKN